jgi:hypothetical protein
MLKDRLHLCLTMNPIPLKLWGLKQRNVSFLFNQLADEIIECFSEILHFSTLCLNTTSFQT